MELGVFVVGQLLTMAHCERDRAIRIISARHATRTKRRVSFLRWLGRQQAPASQVAYRRAQRTQARVCGR